MSITLAYKFRLYPTEDQKTFLAKHFGCTRFVYNYLLNYRSEKWKNEQKSVSGYDSIKLITSLKRKPEYVWLNEVNSQSLQAAAKNLDAAYKNFFRKKGRYPSFKSKHSKQSFRVPQNFSITETGIRIPKLKTEIKAKFHREMQNVEKVHYLTISKTPTEKYYVSITVTETAAVQTNKTHTAVGIDLGLKDFIVDSRGNKIPGSKYLRNSERRLKRAQRALSRKKKGSQNRAKQRYKVALLHEKVRNQRHDFLHKLSSKLIHENQVICIEDLNVKGMLRNRHLSKSISDSGWSEFTRQLQYKADWYGSTIITIGRFEPSSKTCSACSAVYHDLSLSERHWVCSTCGTQHDRDINAAKNILTIGLGRSDFKSVEKETAVIPLTVAQVSSEKQKPLAS